MFRDLSGTILTEASLSGKMKRKMDLCGDGRDCRSGRKGEEMKPKTPMQPARPERRDSEVVLALFLSVFLIFAVVLICTVVLRGCAPADGDADTATKTEDRGGETETGAVTPPTPAFAGGTIPKAPFTTGATKSLSDGIFSSYATLVDISTGEILASKNADTTFRPASMTKVMTLIVACEMLQSDQLDETVTMTEEIHNYIHTGGYQGSTCYGIDVNDEYKIRDLLYGIGMESASDCVMLVVRYLCASEEDFVARMNEKASELGLRNTHFDNAIGYESESNYTTANEMSVIMAYALQSDLIREILSAKTYTSRAAGYNSHGVFNPSFPFTYYSTLFSDRLNYYKEKVGQEFSLKNAVLKGGKTGSFVTSSYLVCYAAGGGKTYVLVLGDAPKSTYAAKLYTMQDVKTMFDNYLR